MSGARPGPRTGGAASGRRAAARLLAPLICSGLLLAAAACEGPPGQEPGAIAERAPAPELSEPGGPEHAPSIALESPRPAAAEPAEIYYNLTQYEWYRRGEPLVHQGRDYHATGRPARLDAGLLEHAGEYMGVRYYVLDDGDRAPELPVTPPDILYVPVFDGYWLPFAVMATPRAPAP